MNRHHFIDKGKCLIRQVVETIAPFPPLHASPLYQNEIDLQIFIQISRRRV